MSKSYDEDVRRSIRRDFKKANFKRNGRVPKIPHPKNVRRVIELNEASSYYPFRRFIVGKLFRVLEKGFDGGVWVDFVNDTERDALNSAAGWKDKRRFLFDGVRFDD